jgi:hypothetical protein
MPEDNAATGILTRRHLEESPMTLWTKNPAWLEPTAAIQYGCLTRQVETTAGLQCLTANQGLQTARVNPICASMVQATGASNWCKETWHHLRSLR